MNKEKIIDYIRRNNGAELATIQQEFGVHYREAKAVADELIAEGRLVYQSGVRYAFVEKADKELKNGGAAARNTQGGLQYAYTGSIDERIDEYLESCRRTTQTEVDDDDDDDEEDNGGDEEDEDEELRVKALKIVIKKQNASPAMLLRFFPIGYVKTCKLIDWMEEKGYISSADSFKTRKVLITEEEFEELYCKPRRIEDSGVTDENSSDNKTAAGSGATPQSPLADEEEFKKSVAERLERLVKSDERMGRQGAIKKAECYLEAVRDTDDNKMVRVYERLVYEVKNMSSYSYGLLKKRLFG